MTISNLNPLGYTGLKEQNPPNIQFFKRDPTAQNIIGFDIGDIWINTITQVSWQLLSKANNIAVWSQMAGGIAQIATITGDNAIAISPIAGNINVFGNGAQGISTTGTPATITVSVQDASTAVKGVSTYSATDFTVAGGSVSSKSGWILLGSQQAAASATIDFVNLPAMHDFAVVIRNATPVADGEHLYLQVSQDNGATWIGAGYNSGINYTAFDSAVITNENEATRFIISGSIDNATDYGSTIYLLNANSADNFGITGTAVWNDKALGKTSFGTIGGRTTTGINAFRFIMTAHAIDTGNFSIYGIRE